MLDGHVVKRGTRMISAFRDGIATRATYTTAQDVTLWPVEIDTVEYLQDRSALNAGGLTEANAAGAEAAIRIVLRRSGAGGLADLALDRLDCELRGQRQERGDF